MGEGDGGVGNSVAYDQIYGVQLIMSDDTNEMTLFQLKLTTDIDHSPNVFYYLWDREKTGPSSHFSSLPHYLDPSHFNNQIEAHPHSLLANGI